MALFVRQEENRSELQNRLAAELQDRAKERAKLVDRPDGVSDSEYIKGTKSTTSLVWLWAILIVIAAGVIIWIITLGMAR